MHHITSVRIPESDYQEILAKSSGQSVSRFMGDIIINHVRGDVPGVRHIRVNSTRFAVEPVSVELAQPSNHTVFAIADVGPVKVGMSQALMDFRDARRGYPARVELLVRYLGECWPEDPMTANGFKTLNEAETRSLVALVIKRYQLPYWAGLTDVNYHDFRARWSKIVKASKWLDILETIASSHSSRDVTEYAIKRRRS